MKKAGRWPYSDLGSVCSPDRRKIHYPVDRDGSERFTIEVRSLDNSNIISVSSPETSSSVCQFADIDEFGDPDIDDIRELMLRSSPLATLDFQNCSGVYISCGEHDSRVPMRESLLWTQTLRKRNLAKAPALIGIEFNRGHELYHNENDAIRAIAMETAFILQCSKSKDGV